MQAQKWSGEIVTGAWEWFRAEGTIFVGDCLCCPEGLTGLAARMSSVGDKRARSRQIAYRGDKSSLASALLILPVVSFTSRFWPAVLAVTASASNGTSSAGYAISAERPGSVPAGNSAAHPASGEAVLSSAKDDHPSFKLKLNQATPRVELDPGSEDERLPVGPGEESNPGKPYHNEIA
ncbi:hypothetical protein BDZ91DRAFT_808612 [Kalaharituber pfeilii]|nr:hypothetical protein BDZ91DRAFT_808612 [Kalaharituber pfeilii]